MNVVTKYVRQEIAMALEPAGLNPTPPCAEHRRAYVISKINVPVPLQPALLTLNRPPNAEPAQEIVT
jgi:hypothetical protein